MAGAEGESIAADVTSEALEQVGAKLLPEDTFEIISWHRDSSEIAAGDTVQDCIALPHCPTGQVEAELIDLGYGLPADFENTNIEDAIVLVRSDVPSYEEYIHRTVKYYYAVEQGAAGFIYRNHVEGCLPPTGSVSGHNNPGTKRRETIGDIPAVGVSKEVGARLARRFSNETISLEVDAEINETTSRNVRAQLGPDTDERILVTSHFDAHDISEGAGDNGAGTAMVVGIAEALAAREDDLETCIEFVSFGAEEIGLVGSEYRAAMADSGAIKAVVNLDGVGSDERLLVSAHGYDELMSVADTVAERFGYSIKTTPNHTTASDHWPFIHRGVPGCHVRTDGGEGRGWGHTFADTLDKLDPWTLREQTMMLADYTVTLADSTIEITPRSRTEIATAVEAEGIANGLKVKGDWPFNR